MPDEATLRIKIDGGSSTTGRGSSAAGGGGAHVDGTQGDAGLITRITQASALANNVSRFVNRNNPQKVIIVGDTTGGPGRGSGSGGGAMSPRATTGPGMPRRMSSGMPETIQMARTSSGSFAPIPGWGSGSGSFGARPRRVVPDLPGGLGGGGAGGFFERLLSGGSKAGGAAGGAARMAGGAAGSLGTGALSAAGGLLSSGASALGPLAAVAAAAVGVVVAFKAVSAVATLLVQNMARRTEELAPYSAEIQRSIAMNELRTVQARQRQSETVGASLANFSSARNRLELAGDEALSLIEQQLSNIIAPAIEGIAVLIEMYMPALRLIAKTQSQLQNSIAGDFILGIGVPALGILRIIGKWFGDQEGGGAALEDLLNPTLPEGFDRPEGVAIRGGAAAKRAGARRATGNRKPDQGQINAHPEASGFFDTGT